MPRNAVGTDRVTSFFRRLRARKILAALIIIGTITISVATVTDSAQKLATFFGNLLQNEKQRSLAELEKRKIDVNAPSLIQSADNGDTETVVLLLRAGISPTAKNTQGWTALHWAAMRGHTATAQALIEAQADVNAKDGAGQTPLMEAAAYCHDESVSLLIRGGASLRDPSSATALFWSAQSGCEGTVKRLIDAGMSVNQKQELGWTPLMAACERGHLNVVQTLLSAGADRSISNADGKTALALAQDNGHSDIAAVLQQPGS